MEMERKLVASGGNESLSRQVGCDVGISPLTPLGALSARIPHDAGICVSLGDLGGTHQTINGVPDTWFMDVNVARALSKV